MSYSIFFSPNKQLEIYRSRFELVFAQQKASINKKFYDKFETKQKYIEKFRKSPFKLDSPETSVLYQQKMELLIEKALSMQLKEYEKEIGNTETTISKMEQEIKDLGRCINNETFQGKCDFLLSVYEDNLKEKLQELEKKNKNRILEHQAFQKQKFEQNIENIKNVINIEGLPREEEENLIFLFEEQFNFRLNAFSQKQEIFWSGKKQEIDQKIRRFYETKKLELKKELDRILVNEMDLWEEEKRDKLMNLEKMINSESNPKDFQSLDLEIQVAYQFFFYLTNYFYQEFRSN